MFCYKNRLLLWDGNNEFSPGAKEYYQVFGVEPMKNKGVIMAQVEESDERIMLSLSGIKSDTTEEIQFFEFAKFEYDFVSKEFSTNGVEGYLDENAEKEFGIENYIGQQEMWYFIARTIKDKNPYAYKEIVEHSAFSMIKRYYRGSFWGSWIKCWKLSQDLNFVEQMLKTNNNLWVQNVNSMTYDEFVTRFKVKIPHQCQVIAQEFSRSPNEYNSIMDVLSTIIRHGDGNDAVIFIEYLNCWKGLDSSGIYYDICKICSDMIYLIEKGYNCNQLLKYLTRQHWNYGKANFIPREELNWLRDYVNLSIDNNLKYEQYPSWIEKAHNCLTKNLVAQRLNDQKKAAFKGNVDAYKHLACKIGDYCVVTPTCPQDLVQEGTALSHCVGGYISRIADGKTRILFLRKKEEPEVSLYTFEIDDQLNVIHAKGIFNSDLPEEAMNVLKKWSTKMKKKEDEESGN